MREEGYVNDLDMIPHYIFLISPYFETFGTCLKNWLGSRKSTLSFPLYVLVI